MTTHANGYYRRIIQVRATDSPNVRLGLQEEALGLTPTNTMVVPGVLTYSEYIKRRETWDKVRQTVGLDAEFYKGAANLLFPPDWMNFSASLSPPTHRKEGGRLVPRLARGIGIDPGEGVSKTTMCAVDELGLLTLKSVLTPDTSVIVHEAIHFAEQWGATPDMVCFDRGGGGKQHADRLRSMGYEVRTVAFGETLTPMPKWGKTEIEEQTDTREERTAYKNRRAAMYGDLSEWMDPSLPTNLLNPPGWENIGDGESDLGIFRGFHIPFDNGEESVIQLRKQLAVMPRLYDQEGRVFMPPKNRNPGARDVGTKLKTLVELIGHSPDEADALVLAIFAMTHPEDGVKVGTLF